MPTRTATVALGLVLLLVSAGCTSGARPTGGPGTDPLPGTASSPAVTAPPPSPGGTSGATPTPSGTPSAPPTASATPSLPPVSEPPRAHLEGVDGGSVAGDLGTFAWDGLVSDAPWIVGRVRCSVVTGARLSIGLRPPLQVVAWRARWAKVTGGEAGRPRDGDAGTSGPISVTVPRTAGSWSLQLTAELGPDRSATWYWRVEVTR